MTLLFFHTMEELQGYTDLSILFEDISNWLHPRQRSIGFQGPEYQFSFTVLQSAHRLHAVQDQVHFARRSRLNLSIYSLRCQQKSPLPETNGIRHLAAASKRQVHRVWS